jgi:glucose/arabinose dehydrogenase
MTRLLLLVVSLVLAGGCGSAVAAEPAARLVQVAKGLEKPLGVEADGSPGRLYLLEQPGRIRLMQGGRLLTQPYLNVVDRVTCQGECGFLGIAFHPDFARNGLFYVDYTAGFKKTLHTVIAEYRAQPGAVTVDPSTERILLTIDQPYANHNGGQLRFGPDGMLYIGMGDGGSAGDPGNRAQNPRELLGKILRIDVNDRSDGKPYGVPKDNPFVNDPRFRPEIWAWGMRNPWRFSFDRKTGTCYCGDIGQNKFEELDIITKGGNYGWHIREAMHPFKNQATDPPCTLIDPIVEYPRDKGWSITGGFVYRGKKFPALDGLYIYGDYVSGRFWGLRYEDGKVISNDELNMTVNGQPTLNRVQPSSFGEDLDGELYVCDHSHGIVYQVVAPSPSNLSAK